ncbi:DgyrCDS11285 [Dimorphilus gyrociliatus]|uniref:DgyrCDS11285 n=1 Tax=Dimorphilus gyrociliatus TaxID=2664684 RepID=A0A7I8W458_9ANNE|nr:DgyrCDS11285 [Dimorphilus gyrociliatus]
MKLFFILLFHSCIPTITSCNGSSNSNLNMSYEKKIILDLLANYKLVGLNGRPVINDSTATIVELGLGLVQIDLDEKNRVLTTSMWVKHKWQDEYLRWSPEDYGGLVKIRINPKFVWKPDIMLYNTAAVKIDEREALMVVTHTGKVQWLPHQIFKSSCSVDVRSFPFDEQHCQLWFGSWTYFNSEIDARLFKKAKGIDLRAFQTDYKESCPWEIANTTAKKLFFPSQKDAFGVLTFSLSLKRKFVFTSYVLTLPCVFLAALSLLVFLLPPDRPDRTSLAMSTFSSFLVLLLILVEAAPPTASNIPLLGKLSITRYKDLQHTIHTIHSWQKIIDTLNCV